MCNTQHGSAASLPTGMRSALARGLKPWSKEEDDRLRMFMQQHGPTAVSDGAEKKRTRYRWLVHKDLLAELLPGRAILQIASHWHNKIGPRSGYYKAKDMERARRKRAAQGAVPRRRAAASSSDEESSDPSTSSSSDISSSGQKSSSVEVSAQKPSSSKDNRVSEQNASSDDCSDVSASSSDHSIGVRRSKRVSSGIASARITRISTLNSKRSRSSRSTGHGTGKGGHAGKCRSAGHAATGGKLGKRRSGSSRGRSCRAAPPAKRRL